MSDSYQFNINGRDNTKRAFASVNASLTRMRGLVNSSAVRIGALAGGAALGALVASSLRTQDELAKLSDRIGATTENLATLQHMAVLNGSSSEAMNKGLEKMTRSVGEAARGIGTAKVAIEELNLSADDLSEMGADEQYRVISEAIAGVENASLQASYAADIFGRSGVGLINTIRQGEDGFRAAREEAEALGIAVSRVDAAKAEMANDAIFRAKQAISGLGNQVTNQLAPILDALTTQFTDGVKEAGGMGEAVKSAFDVGVKVAGVFADGIHGIKVIVTGIKLAFYGLGSVIAMVVNGAVEAFVGLGNIVNTAVLWPLKKALETAGMFSDQAAEASREFNQVYSEMTNMEPPQGLRDAMDSMVAGTSAVATDLHNLLMEELPSDVLRGKVDEILASAEVRAQEIAANAASTAGIQTDDGMGEDGSEDARFEVELERLRAQAESRAILLQEQYDADLLLLQQAKEREQVTIEQYERMKENVTKRYAEQRRQIEDRERSMGLANMNSDMTTALSQFGGKSKKMFELNKKASISQAISKGYSAATSAWEAGMATGGPWAPVVAAGYTAASLAKTGAQIASLKSSSFGGGGGGSTGGGGGGLPSISGAATSAMKSLGGDFGSQFKEKEDAPGKQVNFHIKNLQGNDAKKIFEEFKTIIRESDEVLIEPGTRQAMELGG